MYGAVLLSTFIRCFTDSRTVFKTTQCEIVSCITRANLRTKRTSNAPQAVAFKSLQPEAQSLVCLHAVQENQSLLVSQCWFLILDGLYWDI